MRVYKTKHIFRIHCSPPIEIKDKGRLQILGSYLLCQVMVYPSFRGEHERSTAPGSSRWSGDPKQAGHSRLSPPRFGSNVGGVRAWKKWALAMHEFDRSEIRSAESVNGAKTGP